MKAAGLDPALIHAFEKTGLLVTEQNHRLIPENDLAEWDAAIEEYRREARAAGGNWMNPAREKVAYSCATLRPWAQRSGGHAQNGTSYTSPGGENPQLIGLRSRA
jgi:hypothetical protein